MLNFNYSFFGDTANRSTSFIKQIIASSAQLMMNSTTKLLTATLIVDSVDTISSEHIKP